ncbi:MAG TPA: hypothetical protein ENG66_06485 [Thermococcus sp.]|nr:hypothetical protein [Thermococcus sp.]
MVWWKVDSWDYGFCSWCEEIRQKYGIRFRIANKLGLNKEIIQKFDDLRRFAMCPLHKELTVHPAFAKSLGKFSVSCDDGVNEDLAGEPAIIFKWWSNNNDYKAVLRVESKCIDFYKNGDFIATLTNHNLIAELLTLLSKDELEMIEKFLEKFLKELKEFEEKTEIC